MRRILCVTTCCVLIIASSVTTLAEQSPVARADWTAVTSLTGESTIEIELVSGERLTGRFRSATADAVRVSVRGEERALLQRTIRRVALVGRRTTGKQARRGLIIGGLAGGVVGAWASQEGRAGWSVFTAGIWGAIGGGIGAIVGYSRRERTILYFDKLAATNN